VVIGIAIGAFASNFLYVKGNGDPLGMLDYSKILSKSSNKTFLPPISDREFWDNLENKPRKLTEAEFKDRYGGLEDRVALAAATRLLCTYPDDGFYIPIIETCIKNILKVHSPRPNKPNGFRMIGLQSTTDVAVVSNSLMLLSDKLPPQFVADSKVWINRNILAPFLSEYDRAQKEKIKWWGSICPWMGNHNNWTAVCTSNILYIALAVGEPDSLKYRVVDACINLAKEYLNYFEEDGACPGGIRYWTYGMYYYVLMAERLLQASGGEINLYDHPRIPSIFGYPLQTMFGDIKPFLNQYPNFGDNNPSEVRVYWVYALLRNRINFPYVLPHPDPDGVAFNFFFDAYYSPYKIPTPKIDLVAPGKTTVYESNSLIVIRDLQNSLIFAFKGGNNGEEHNHNDVGTFSLFMPSAGGVVHLVGDLGADLYKKDHFKGESRYTFDGLSSFGHPLPIVGNTLQGTGSQYYGKLVPELSDPSQGIIVIDLTECYLQPGLESLIRTIKFKDGVLVVRDEFTSSFPLTFQTIIPTRLSFEMQTDGFLLKSSEVSLKVLVDSSTPYLLKTRPSQYFKFGQLVNISLQKPALAGFIEYTISK
jgi:hypothetical protein